MNVDTILAQLDILGYTVEITPDTEHPDSVVVSFHGRYRAPLKRVRSFSCDMAHREIRRACAEDFMRWSGFRVVERLVRD